MHDTDETMGVREVAELLGVALGTVYSMRHKGIGPVGWRRGKRLVYRRADVESFLIRERALTVRGQGV